MWLFVQISLFILSLIFWHRSIISFNLNSTKLTGGEGRNTNRSHSDRRIRHVSHPKRSKCKRENRSTTEQKFAKAKAENPCANNAHGWIWSGEGALWSCVVPRLRTETSHTSLQRFDKAIRFLASARFFGNHGNYEQFKTCNSKLCDFFRYLEWTILNLYNSLKYNYDLCTNFVIILCLISGMYLSMWNELIAIWKIRSVL